MDLLTNPNCSIKKLALLRAYWERYFFITVLLIYVGKRHKGGEGAVFSQFQKL